jgi:hypothetical protein
MDGLSPKPGKSTEMNWKFLAKMGLWASHILRDNGKACKKTSGTPLPDFSSASIPFLVMRGVRVFAQHERDPLRLGSSTYLLDSGLSN